MTGPFRPLFGPFCTDILSERRTNAPEPCQKERPAALFPKARFKVANKQVTDDVVTSAETNPRLEVAGQSQSSGEEHSELDKQPMSSPAVSESGEEERSADPSMEGLVQDQGALDKNQTELNLVAGFTDSLSNFLRANFQEPIPQEGEVVKPNASGGNSMQALLAGMNESLPAFAGNSLVVVPDSAPLDNVGPMDFTDAFPPLPMTQGDSMPTFRDFFSQHTSNATGNTPTGIADHRFYQPQAQKAKLVTRRAPVEACATPCSEKRKADWDDAPNPGGREDSEEMETDGERGAQEASSDKGCEGRKSPRTLTRTEEQRMKDRAKAKRHRARKKVQEANDKSTICHLEAEVDRLKKALKLSEDAQAESEKVTQTLEKEVELWKTAYRDLGKTMSDMLKVGGAGVAAKPTPS